MQLAASLLAAQGLHLEGALQLAHAARVDALHVDVMDGHFVPNIAFGPMLVAEIAAASCLPLHVHLMVTEPRKLWPLYKMAEVIAFHGEVEEDPCELASDMKKEGIAPWLAISPDTSLEALPQDASAHFCGCLVMGVQPGWSAQSMLPGTFQRILDLAARFPTLPLAVDGGVNANNFSQLKDLGVRSCVIGSAFYKAREPEKIRELLKSSSPSRELSS